MSEWISVEDELPKKGVFVLVYIDDECMEAEYCSFEDGEVYWSCKDSRTLNTGCFPINYWMPLPEPPINSIGEDSEPTTTGIC